jgi:hypothetical protein
VTATTCSLVNQLDTSVIKDIDALFPSRDFFKHSFRAMIESELAHRRGAHGLPGTILPDVALAVLAQMRKGIPAVLAQYAESVARVAREAIVAEIGGAFEGFPSMRRLLVTEAQRVCDEQLVATRAHYENLIKWEEVVHTSNHYFMTTVTKVRAAIAAAATHKAEEEDEEEEEEEEEAWSHTISFADAARLAGGANLSNEEQKAIDMQIELFACVDTSNHSKSFVCRQRAWL